ncbi:TPA: choloylglycine hydrolase, partial [Clostridium perfringens]|nr:choloylglycine hydrolase [Clostridium perfringens]
AVDMNKEDLESSTLFTYNLINNQIINYLN